MRRVKEEEKKLVNVFCNLPREGRTWKGSFHYVPAAGGAAEKIYQKKDRFEMFVSRNESQLDGSDSRFSFFSSGLNSVASCFLGGGQSFNGVTQGLFEVRWNSTPLFFNLILMACNRGEESLMIIYSQ